MSIEIPGASALDIEPCRYGASKLVCRGPLRRPEKPYFAFLGDGETFGKFVRRPFAGLVELATGQPCVNLGGANTGLDAYLADPDILEIAANSETAVVQAMGPQNLTNRFYRVHPRRNDRFIAPAWSSSSAASSVSPTSRSTILRPSTTAARRRRS